MIESIVECAGTSMKLTQVDTVVIGSGASAYNAALRLDQYGRRDIVIVTDFIQAGTSRNTGSDKQTYYKLTLSGGEADSVREMAQTLFDGTSMDGDNALVEAALSAESFLHLVELGVPFPRNRYGEYIGYKTDHDPRRRATSIGPYTSRRMTEQLEAAVNARNIQVMDRLQVIKIFKDDTRAIGILCLNTKQTARGATFQIFSVNHIVMATGGPAAMYRDSVFPHGHYGANGLAFEAGARGQNLTEWQFGLASVRPRWNVSGTYMQVLPRMLSTNEDASDEREFLFDFFGSRSNGLSQLFMKGYQWPFDVRKVKGGSSIIDVLVYIEQSKGRRVFLDFRSNPQQAAIDFKSLSPEAYEYLDRAQACFGTPVERLRHMNEPAYSFYLDRGVDLETSLLEIALCAQHNNGGISVDHWWQSSLPGLFVVGEAAGTHGVYRPGGSALNSGQVGSARAARFIASQSEKALKPAGSFLEEIADQAADVIALSRGPEGHEKLDEIWQRAAARMSQAAGAIREASAIRQALAACQDELLKLESGKIHFKPTEVPRLYRLRDMLISQSLYMSAMLDYIQNDGKSRGSALYSDERAERAYENLDDRFRFILDDGSRRDLIQECSIRTVESAEGRRRYEAAYQWRKVRPIPEEDDFFENVWRDYRENGNVY